MIFFFHDWEFPPKVAPSVYHQGMDGKSGCLKGDSTGIDFLLCWLVHQLEPSGEGGAGSLLATHLPTVHWCYVAHGVAGPNMVWVVTGLVDRSCGIGWIAVLVPAPTALATSALWRSFLQVHAAPGSSTGAGSTLRLVFRQLLGCWQSENHSLVTQLEETSKWRQRQSDTWFKKSKTVKREI